MPSVYLVADPHWSHHGVCRFLKADGTKLRPWDNPKDMDEAMIDLWNQTVKPKDKVYVLGDWCINRRALDVGPKLNGDKVLIKGNHDIFRLEEYTPTFRDIRAYHVLKGQNVILSHIPVHPGQLNRYTGGNIHGHMHSNSLEDKRYLCVSVEQTDFKPILMERALELLKMQTQSVDKEKALERLAIGRTSSGY